jgi:hypothetical protein
LAGKYFGHWRENILVGKCFGGKMFWQENVLAGKCFGAKSF